MGDEANGRRLLILSCARKKRISPESLPALERYDGPAFRSLRKFIVECPVEARSLDVRILSAKLGLIRSDQPIVCYDLAMTASRAMELNPSILDELKRLLARRKYRKLFINAGENYLRALAGYESLMPDDLEVTVSDGSVGRRQSMLRDWLYGGPPPSPSLAPQGRARVRGVEIELTPEEALDIACRALADGEGELNAYQSWYVPINGHRVAPKWLISQLTGLPVGSFVTDEARRALAQLGIEVRRV